MQKFDEMRDHNEVVRGHYKNYSDWSVSYTHLTLPTILLV